MTTLRKVLPFTFLVMLALATFTGQHIAYAQQADCGPPPFTFTGDATQTAVPNLSQNTPCANWRVTFTTTGTLSTTVTFQTSPDKSTWTSVPTTICSSTVQPPCTLQGTNPLTGTAQGMAYFSAYGNYVRVTTTGSSGTGTGTVRMYGAKGATANAPSGGGGAGNCNPAGTATQIVTGGVAGCTSNPATLDASNNFAAPDTTTTPAGDIAFRGGNATSGRGGMATLEAGTSTSGVQGLTRIVGSWNGAATVNRIVCVDTSASSTVAGCSAGANVGLIGVALTTSTPVQVVTNGDALIDTDNTATVGANVCISTTVAGKGHSTGAAICPPGTVIGVVRSITALSAVGQASATTPLVSVGVIAAGQAGSAGNRIVTGVTDALLESDNGKWVIYNSAAPVAVTLACPSASGFLVGWMGYIKNANAGTVTVTAVGGCYFDNALPITTIVMPPGQGTIIESDGTNFYTQKTSGGGISGGIPYFSDFYTQSSSAALTQYGVVLGGGVAGAPTSTAADTTTTHALFATAGAPAFRAIVAGDLPAPTSPVSAYPTVTDGSPIAWNLGSAVVTNGIVTLIHTTATRALNLSNIVNGGFYTLVIKQDATGGALMTLGTGCTWKVVNQGAGAIVLTAAANAIDVLAFTYDGTNCYAIAQSNFN